MRPRGSQVAANASRGQNRAKSGPLPRIANVHPVDASNDATRSSTTIDSGIVNPSPPSSAGTNIRNTSVSCSASITADERVTEPLRLGRTVADHVGDLLDAIEHHFEVRGAHRSSL